MVSLVALKIVVLLQIFLIYSGPKHAANLVLSVQLNYVNKFHCIAQYKNVVSEKYGRQYMFPLCGH